MPQSVEKCVNKIKQTVTPRDPKQTKEDAAWAICTDAYNKKKKKRNQSSIEESIANIKDIAQQVQTRDARLANRLVHVAQGMESMMQEMPPMMQGAPMATESSPDVNIDVGGASTPPIESFHKPIKQVRTHKITMTFEAPPDMSEGDIMDTFFKIMPDSGLQPLNFSWADATPTNDGNRSTNSKK